MKNNKNIWKNVTDAFSEQQRHFRGTYMEIDEVYDDNVEVALFSSLEDLYEIYVCYGIMYGIIRVESDKSWGLRDEIKRVLEKDYEDNREPSGDFINAFAEKYHLELEI